MKSLKFKEMLRELTSSIWRCYRPIGPCLRAQTSHTTISSVGVLAFNQLLPENNLHLHNVGSRCLYPWGSSRPPG